MSRAGSERRTLAIAVRVTPRAAEDAVHGADEDGTLRIRLRAAPADGEANRSLTRLLAAELGLHKVDVTLVHGASGRRKVIALEGADAAHLRTRWPGVRILTG